MAEWRWYAHDLATGALGADLAVASWSHEDRLNDAGPFSVTLASSGNAVDLQAVQATLPARSTITPIRNGMPLGFCGVVWAADLPGLSGAALLSYFDDQSLDVTKAYASVDQHMLLADLVKWVQTNGGNVQVDTSQVGLSGVLRTQTWYQWEQKNVGGAFRQKADNLDGYDFDFRVESDAGNLVRRLRLWTPRRGRAYQPQASPVFKVGENVTAVPSAPANGGDMVTHVCAVGAETGTVTTVGDAEVRERLTYTYVNTDALAAGYPRLSHTIELNDVKELTTLAAHAEGYAARNAAVAIDQIVLDVNPDDPTWPWWTYDVGDDCMVVVPAHTEPWWPAGLSEVRRIVTHRWSIDDGGEHLQVVTGRPLG